MLGGTCQVAARPDWDGARVAGAQFRVAMKQPPAGVHTHVS